MENDKSIGVPDQDVTPSELRRNTGERFTRKWIAYDDIVYDVTECPRWQKEMHEMLHYPGQDLSSELVDAPHEEDIFSRPCVKIVGRLKA